MPTVLHVALVFGNDEGEARNFGAEGAQLDAAKVCEGDVAFALWLAAQVVDGGFDLAHLLVGDDEKVAAAAGGVEHADAGHALAQVEQFGFVAAGFGQFGAQVI